MTKTMTIKEFMDMERNKTNKKVSNKQLYMIITLVIILALVTGGNLLVEEPTMAAFKFGGVIC